MGVHQPLRPVLCRFRGAVADNRAPLANGRPKVGPLFSADEMVAMKKQLQGKDVESSSKNRDQFSEFIVGKLQDRAREQGRNPMAVKAPNDKVLLELRRDTYVAGQAVHGPVQDQASTTRLRGLFDGY